MIPEDKCDHRKYTRNRTRKSKLTILWERKNKSKRERKLAGKIGLACEKVGIVGAKPSPLSHRARHTFRTQARTQIIPRRAKVTPIVSSAESSETASSC